MLCFKHWVIRQVRSGGRSFKCDELPAVPQRSEAGPYCIDRSLKTSTYYRSTSVPCVLTRWHWSFVCLHFPFESLEYSYESHWPKKGNKTWVVYWLWRNSPKSGVNWRVDGLTGQKLYAVKYSKLGLTFYEPNFVSTVCLATPEGLASSFRCIQVF